MKCRGTEPQEWRPLLLISPVRRHGSCVNAGSNIFPFDPDIGQQVVVELLEQGDVAAAAQPFLQLLFQMMQHFDVLW